MKVNKFITFIPVFLLNDKIFIKLDELDKLDNAWTVFN